MTEKIRIEKPWSEPVETVLEKLQASAENGLDSGEAKKRLKKYGRNRLQEKQRKPAWSVLADQFKSLIMGLLAIAAVLSFLFGDTLDGIAIVAVILLTAAIGFFTELRAIRSMEALRELSRVSADVIRDGKARQISAEELVPGDIVVLDGGEIVTADLRIIESNKMQADESALTGESVPVGKTTDPLGADTELAGRQNMLFKGTAVTRGSGAGVVVASGMQTELGKISSLVQEAEEEVTPLEKRLDQLGNNLVWFTLGLTAFVAAIGIVRGRDIFMMIETAIALAVAAIPEGLPIVATVALARGMLRMARRNALINRLASVETLGATNVIFTDKTGTLTENKMTMTEIRLPAGEVHISGEGYELAGDFTADGQQTDPREREDIARILKIGVLCNNASLPSGGGEGEADSIGDPLEVSLLVAGAKAGYYRDDLLQEKPEEREEAFDPATKMMATFHRTGEKFLVAVKGAPEAVVEACSQVREGNDIRSFQAEDREKWRTVNQQMAENGLRVLAMAERQAEDAAEDPYGGLTFLGLVGLLDPPRSSVREAIRKCREAGIRVIMVTGDQPVTAGRVAEAVELTGEKDNPVMQGSELQPYEEMASREVEEVLAVPIFARVSPKQKLDLIGIHQHNNAIVAMTGDGVNDAPALKKADIGIAMGKRGTQVAREAADMVLKDDAFSSIVAAVEHGRVIFNNIRNFVIFLLSGNVGEILSVALASLFSAPLPILPLQILFINLILDVFPALALGIGRGSPDILQKPPRNPKEPIIGREHWWAISGYGIIISVGILASLLLALFRLGMPEEQAVTISFMTLGFARLWHVFNMRDTRSRLFVNEVTRNPFVWGAIVLCAGLLLAAVYLPGLSGVLRTQNPGVQGWTLILLMSLLPLLVIQGYKLVRRYLV